MKKNRQKYVMFWDETFDFKHFIHYAPGLNNFSIWILIKIYIEFIQSTAGQAFQDQMGHQAKYKNSS